MSGGVTSPGRRIGVLALVLIAVLFAAVLFAAARPAADAAAAESPIGAHSMLQLDDPPAFMEAMFAQAAAMGASAIRLDVSPAVIFGNQSAAPDYSGLDE